MYGTVLPYASVTKDIHTLASDTHRYIDSGERPLNADMGLSWSQIPMDENDHLNTKGSVVSHNTPGMGRAPSIHAPEPGAQGFGVHVSVDANHYS